MTLPAVRYLADGSAICAGPKMARDQAGALSFIQDPDDTEVLTVDWTGMLGAETISSATWNADGLTLASDAISGKTTTVKVSAVPLTSYGTAKISLVTSGGRTIVRRFRFYGGEM